MRAQVVLRSLYRALLAKTKKSQNKNMDQQNDSKNKQIQKNKAIVGVCSAGMKFCSRAEACSPFFLFMLRCAALEWPWVRDFLAYVDRDVCVCK